VTVRGKLEGLSKVFLIEKFYKGSCILLKEGKGYLLGEGLNSGYQTGATCKGF